MPNLSVDSSLDILADKINKEVEAGKTKIGAFIRKQSTLTMLKVGGHVVRYIRKNPKTYGRREELCSELSKRTNLDATTLRRAAQFYEDFPKSATWHNLDWSKVKMILPLDSELKEILLKETAENNWSVKRLAQEIKMRKSSAIEGIKDIPVLKDLRGELGLCQVIADPLDGELKLDVGFKNRLKKRSMDVSHFKEGQILKIDESRAKTVLTIGKYAIESMFTYVARVIRVVDGDTLVVNVDLGFGVEHEERLRLASIDCPEIDTEEGKKAKAFVENQLKSCKHLVIRTYKERVDLHDRYLANVYYLPNETDPQKTLTEGAFLNQILLNAGLAVKV